jgi:hypothetical protein
MKGKYITAQVLLACWSGRMKARKNIHEKIKETLDERERVLGQLKRQSRLGKVVDMYLEEYKIA